MGGLRLPLKGRAGVGRGATGFTTRSDIGPARSSTAIGVRPYTEEDEDEYCEEKLDENFGLFASAEDEEEADAVWEWIDRRIASRRKDRIEVRMKQEIQKNRALNPNITEQFAGLKRKLSTITAEEWDGIPENL
ncbi:PRP1_N domain-containing protein/TPR_14 domain-containing protein [Cinnamomum micranthum f. kanehirae]|uniref:PRP1_N domain-containing protein/TPR_14 domain-containing protein n=1 Tax=Cinnamomum micranthum f. kanehirae TaxID=337451 RepID=A0A443PTW1_9MAGN|nr:PRP1_N domain-containing protein/TPR_14 domain-containing protein [Cinnamomum micranthum f. kanehirae]